MHLLDKVICFPRRRYNSYPGNVGISQPANCMHPKTEAKVREWKRIKKLSC